MRRLGRRTVAPGHRLVLLHDGFVTGADRHAEVTGRRTGHPRIRHCEVATPVSRARCNVLAPLRAALCPRHKKELRRTVASMSSLRAERSNTDAGSIASSHELPVMTRRGWGSREWTQRSGISLPFIRATETEDSGRSAASGSLLIPCFNQQLIIRLRAGDRAA